MAKMVGMEGTDRNEIYHDILVNVPSRD